MSEASKSLKPQELQRLQADLERRVKELNARQEYLQQREYFIEHAPLDLTVLEETIRVKTNQLDRVKADFQKKEKWYKERLADFDEKLAESKRELDVRCEEVEVTTDVFHRAEQDLIHAMDERKKLDISNQERKHYLEEQEKVIAEAIDEGNAVLRGINFEIQAAQEEREAIKIDLAELETNKTTATLELMEFEERSINDQVDARQKLENMEQQVSDEKEVLAQVKSDQEKASQYVDEKLVILSRKETELQVKREALVKEKRELEEEKRRWNSTKSLYDV